MLTEPGESVLVVQHPDVDVVARAVESAGWRLRSHHHAMERPKPDPLTASLADMRAEIEALRARVDAAEGMRG